MKERCCAETVCILKAKEHTDTVLP